MKLNLLSIAVGLSVLVLSSCSKDPLQNLSTEESRIYITDYDNTVNFKNYATFSISDSVAVINNNQVSKQSTEVDKAFINAIKAEMVFRGYQLVNKNADPDLGINVNRIYNTSTGIISYNDFYDYYNGYWDPFYWGYSGYNYYNPYSYSVYSITEGALSIDILDLKNAQSNNRINIIWTGLIRGSGIFNAATAASQVNALFSQSNYINAD